MLRQLLCSKYCMESVWIWDTVLVFHCSIYSRAPYNNSHSTFRQNDEHKVAWSIRTDLGNIHVYCVLRWQPYYSESFSPSANTNNVFSLPGWLWHCLSHNTWPLVSLSLASLALTIGYAEMILHTKNKKIFSKEV